MSDFYFMSGYTGFCPNLPEKIGQGYCDSTRQVMRDRPQTRSRLGDVHWREAQTGDVTLRSGNAYKCGFTPEIPSCNRDDSKVRCPLQAHPLVCTQFGSPCMDKCCETQCYDQRPRNEGGDASFLICENEADSRHFKECHPCEQPKLVCYPGFCSKGGPCGEEMSCCVKLPRPRPEPMLPNCNPCVKDPLDVKKAERPPPGPSRQGCSYCSKSGPCDEELSCCVKLTRPRPEPVLPNCNPCVKDPLDIKKPERPLAAARQGCGCCCPVLMGEPDECSRKYDDEKPMVQPPCFQNKYRNYKMRPYRKCGVIPNYMGYIPGIQMTFGETYGITANRLLKRHFNEQSKRC